MNRYLAVDIGASSGRHIVGWLEGGELVWVVSTGDDEYNTMKGTYEIADDSVTLTVVNEGASMSFVSDECITRDVITFTGAIGKYSIVLTHDDQ